MRPAQAAPAGQVGGGTVTGTAPGRDPVPAPDVGCRCGRRSSDSCRTRARPEGAVSLRGRGPAVGHSHSDLKFVRRVWQVGLRARRKQVRGLADCGFSGYQGRRRAGVCSGFPPQGRTPVWSSSSPGGSGWEGQFTLRPFQGFDPFSGCSRLVRSRGSPIPASHAVLTPTLTGRTREPAWTLWPHLVVI